MVLRSGELLGILTRKDFLAFAFLQSIYILILFLK